MSTQITEVWSDLDHRFVADGLGNLKKVINVQAVQTSIDNILRTRKGERVMLPEFGSNLSGILFEPTNSTMIDFLSRDLKQSIERWDDRVLVTEIKYLQEPDLNTITLQISFMIKGYSKVFTYEKPIKGEI